MKTAALLIALTATALADGRFDRAYQAGQDAFYLGKYDEALAAFTRARDLLPRLPGPHRWRGRTLRVLERWEECVVASTQAVRLRPDSPTVPEVKKDLDACRAALGRPGYDRPLPAGQGALAVIADADGAAVTVDGIAKGKTPLQPMPLMTGRHAVALELGDRRVTVNADVIAGVVVDCLVTLR
jgi:hypothetical protein